MKYFGYEVLYDDEHIRKLKVKCAVEQGTAEIDKDNHKITFHNFSESFDNWLHKGFVERFLWASLKNFPDRKRAAFGS